MIDNFDCEIKSAKIYKDPSSAGQYVFIDLHISNKGRSSSKLIAGTMKLYDNQGRSCDFNQDMRIEKQVGYDKFLIITAEGYLIDESVSA